MWVMTQDKKNLINIDATQTIYVTPNGFSKKKSAIMAHPSNTILGYYDDEKCAMDELENINNAIINGKKSYQMP